MRAPRCYRRPTRGGGSVHGSVTVPLNKEGVAYGYWVVVKSRAGLGKAGAARQRPAADPR